MLVKNLLVKNLLVKKMPIDGSQKNKLNNSSVKKNFFAFFVFPNDSEARGSHGRSFSFTVPVLKILLAILLVIQLAPLVMVIQTAFKTPRSLLQDGSFSLEGWTTENFSRLFVEQSFGLDLLNSLIVAFSSMLISMVAGALMAFALTRWQGRGRKNLFSALLIARLLPPVGLALPLFLVLRELSLHDTRLGLILALTALNFPLVTWILLPFMDAVPRALEEVASLEGAKTFQIFFSITLPLVRPGLVVAGLFSFLMSWNDFLFSLILAGSEVKTAPLTLAGYITGFGTEWGPLCAGASVLLLPVLGLSFKLHQHMIAAPTQGGVKGA